MYFITTKRMLEVCFSVHPNIQYRTFFVYPCLSGGVQTNPGNPLSHSDNSRTTVLATCCFRASKSSPLCVNADFS